MVDPVAVRSAASWAIEPLPSDDLEALAAFQQEAYADQFNARFVADRRQVLRRLIWQYRQVPGAAGDRLPVWVLRQGSVIVGQMAITPVVVKLGSEWLRGGWCQDLVVAPAYRHRGAGGLLVQEAVRDAGADFRVILTGGTNPASYPLFVAAGFRDVGVLPRHVGLTTIARALSLGRHRRRTGETVDGGPSVEADVEQWWKAHETAYRMMIRRDQAWVRWRFQQHPHWQYQIWVARRNGTPAGYLVARMGYTVLRGRAFRTCRIVECAAHASLAPALFAQALRYGVEHQAVMMRGDLLCRQAAAAAPGMFRRVGMWAVPSSNRLLIHTGGRTVGQETDSLQEWFLSGADSDFDLYDAA